MSTVTWITDRCGVPRSWDGRSGTRIGNDAGRTTDRRLGRGPKHTGSSKMMNTAHEILNRNSQSRWRNQQLTCMLCFNGMNAAGNRRRSEAAYRGGAAKQLGGGAAQELGGIAARGATADVVGGRVSASACEWAPNGIVKWVLAQRCMKPSPHALTLQEEKRPKKKKLKFKTSFTTAK